MDRTGLLEEFRAEAREHVQALDARLLELERAPADSQLVREMFLSAHSVKGAAATMGFAALRSLAHAVEDVLARLRDGGQPIDAPTADALFRAVDCMAELVEGRSPGVARMAEVSAALLAGAGGAPEPAPSEPAASSNAGRVLLVEDSATVRMLEQMQLAELGLEVDALGDGRQAVARALEQPYDLVVSGVEIRGLRGLELVAVLKALPQYQSRPFVLMTSDENAADRRRAAELGVDAYIRRGDFGQRRLIETVRELLGRAEAPPPGRGGLVLVADDSAANRRLTAALVERLGYEVETAANGHEVLAALARRPPSAVLMDCQMPDMDGFEASRRIRAAEANAHHLPIIALTADAGPADQARCQAAGMDDFLAKPVRSLELAVALEKWIRPVPLPVGEGGRRPGEGPLHPVAPAKPPPDADPIDRAALEWIDELRELGKEEEVAPLFDTFFSETESRLAALRQALADQDKDAVKRVAHSLKGSCGFFGVRELRQMAVELEEYAAGSAPAPDAAADRLDAAFSRARAALADWRS